MQKKKITKSELIREIIQALSQDGKYVGAKTFFDLAFMSEEDLTSICKLSNIKI